MALLVLAALAALAFAGVAFDGTAGGEEDGRPQFPPTR
jgi:hypothetical protein